MKGFYRISPYRAIECRGRWANLNCLGGASHFLQPFFGHGFAGRIKGCRRSPITKVIRGVSKVFIRIILELERELRRLNFFFLRCSWFGRELNIRILGCARVEFGWWGALKVRLGLLLGLTRISTKEEFSKMWSRISLPSVGVLCTNEPPAAMSRSSAESMSNPV